MYQISLYAKHNFQARRDAEQVIKENAKLVQWRKDGHDTLIDIGSGPGDVLRDFLYPLLPANYKELVVSDIYDKTLSYARECFRKDDRIKFQDLDIGTEILPLELRGRFDHVTSFYCLQWVQNHRKMLENIYELLSSDGGDCLLLFLASSVLYEAYEILAKSTKWSVYMQDYDQFISPYQNSVDAAAEFRKLLQQAGFVDGKVELRNEKIAYEGVNVVREIFQGVCPFFKRIPEQLHEEFCNGFLKVLENMNIRESIEGTDDYRFVTPYKLLIVYARKSKVGEKKK